MRLVAARSRTLVIVTVGAKKILEDALALPNDERRRIAELLFDSISTESTERIEAAWVEEAVRRADPLERREVEALDFVEDDYHHEVNLFQGAGRANASNWTRVKTRDNSWAHETGHLLGFYDEYSTGAVGTTYAGRPTIRRR